MLNLFFVKWLSGHVWSQMFLMFLLKPEVTIAPPVGVVHQLLTSSHRLVHLCLLCVVFVGTVTQVRLQKQRGAWPVMMMSLLSCSASEDGKMIMALWHAPVGFTVKVSLLWRTSECCADAGRLPVCEFLFPVPVKSSGSCILLFPVQCRDSCEVTWWVYSVTGSPPPRYPSYPHAALISCSERYLMLQASNFLSSDSCSDSRRWM